MAERGGYGVKRNYKLLNWEQNEFPIACENCLGESEYLRMLKKPLGGECKLCTRPYTTFNWKTKSTKAKMIKTEICSTCAKINNCCQSCIYDLKYNLPIDIRNKLMGDQKVELLMSEGNRDLFAHLANENYDKLQLPYDNISEKIDEKIKLFIEKNSKENMVENLNENSRDKKELENSLKDKISNKYYKMDEEQKDITEIIYKAEKIFQNTTSNLTKIGMKHVYASEKEIIEKKIEDFIDCEFELIFEKDYSLINFDTKENAEKFFKIFLDCFTINGRKVNLDWFSEKEETDVKPNDFNLPPIPDTINPNIDKVKIQNMFLENLNKNFAYNTNKDKKSGKLNLVNY